MIPLSRKSHIFEGRKSYESRVYLVQSIKHSFSVIQPKELKTFATVREGQYRCICLFKIKITIRMNKP